MGSHNGSHQSRRPTGAPLLVVTLFFSACTERAPTPIQTPPQTAPRVTAPKPAPQPASRPMLDGLPVIGVLTYDKVLTTELTAAFDVFTKHPEGEKARFHVVTIAETLAPVTTEEGMRIVPDFDFDSALKLTVLVVPSAYDMRALVANKKLVQFIKQRDAETKFTMSNCAGAQLIGASGVADGRKIVTWIGGGAELQKTYPRLKVQDDATVAFVRDGKYFSSNGNLVSYVPSLELLEVMTSAKHRAFVESYLYVERFKSWSKP